MAVEIPKINRPDLAYITARYSPVVKNIFTFLVGDKATYLALDRIWTPVKDLGACAGVNKKWSALASESDLWERIRAPHFPSIKHGEGVMGRCLARLAAIQRNLNNPDARFRTEDFGYEGGSGFIHGNPNVFAAVHKGTIQVRDLNTRADVHAFNFEAFSGRLSTLEEYYMAQGKFATIAKDENNKYCFLIWDINAPEKFRSVSLPGLEGVPAIGFVEDKIIFARADQQEVFSVFFLRDERIREYPLSQEFRNYTGARKGIVVLGGLKNLIFITPYGNMTEIFDLSTGTSKGIENSSYREILPMGNRWLVHKFEFARSGPPEENWHSLSDVLEVRDEGLSSNCVWAESRGKRWIERSAGKCFVLGKNILHATRGYLGIYSAANMNRISDQGIERAGLKMQLSDGKLHILRGSRLTLLDFSQLAPPPLEEPPPPIDPAPVPPPPVLPPAQPIDLAPVLPPVVLLPEPPPVQPINPLAQDEETPEDFFEIVRELIYDFFDWLWHSIRNCLGLE